MSTLRNPLTSAVLILLVILAVTFVKSGSTQTLKDQKKDPDQELVAAVRKGGLREAARLKRKYVSSTLSSGWTKFDLEALGENSTTIIVGTPLLSASRLSESGEHIFTDHSVRVEQTLKGSVKPNQVIRLTVLGGKVIFDDGSSAEIQTSDLGPIEIGKTYVLFLKNEQSPTPDHFNLTGGGQGLFEITSESTVKPRGAKVDTVQKYKHAPVTAFVEEIKANVKKHPQTPRCCN
jgi:hypothetical protein